jgi:hypothetical protein
MTPGRAIANVAELYGPRIKVEVGSDGNWTSMTTQDFFAWAMDNNGDARSSVGTAMKALRFQVKQTGPGKVPVYHFIKS